MCSPNKSPSMDQALEDPHSPTDTESIPIEFGSISSEDSWPTLPPTTGDLYSPRPPSSSEDEMDEPLHEVLEIEVEETDHPQEAAHSVPGPSAQQNEAVTDHSEARLEDEGQIVEIDITSLQSAEGNNQRQERRCCHIL